MFDTLVNALQKEDISTLRIMKIIRYIANEENADCSKQLNELQKIYEEEVYGRDSQQNDS